MAPTTDDNNVKVLFDEGAHDHHQEDEEDDDDNNDDKPSRTTVETKCNEKDDDCSDLTGDNNDDGDNNDEVVARSFPQKLLDILSNEDHADIISWLPHGNGFAIHKKKAFADEVLNMYFKATKFTSFTRKLNRWGFNRVPRGPETGAYFHKLFRRDKPELVMQMTSNSGGKAIPAAAAFHQQNAAAAAMMSTVMPTMIPPVGMPMFQYAAPNPMMFTTQEQLVWQQQMMLYGHQMQMMQLQIQQQQQQQTQLLQQQQQQQQSGSMSPAMTSPQALMTSPVMGMGMQSPIGMMPGMMTMPMPGMSPMMPTMNQMPLSGMMNNQKTDDAEAQLLSPISTADIENTDADVGVNLKIEDV